MFVRSLALVALLWASAGQAQQAALPSAEFESLARQCAPSVHPRTLAAVVQHESGFNPLAIGINKGARLPRQPKTVASAVATAEYLAANGFNFDSGLGQINSVNVRKFGLSWSEVFDACANLGAAARVLTDCYQRASGDDANPQTALRAALSCYNTGSFTRGHANGYVAKVERAAGTSPAAVVPAIALVGESPPSVAGTHLVVQAPLAPLVAPDAFGRGRGDAFERAILMAQTDMVPASIDQALAVAPIVLEAGSAPADQSGGFK